MTKGNKRLMYTVFLVISIGNITYLIYRTVLINNVALDGKKLKHVEDQIKVIEEENQQLRSELYKLSSLFTIIKKAEKLGMKVLTGDNIKFYK